MSAGSQALTYLPDHRARFRPQVVPDVERLGSLLNQGYRDGMADVVAGLPPQVAERVLGSVAFTAAPELAALGETGERLVAQGLGAFVDGIAAALLTGSAILVAAAVLVAALAPRPWRQTSSEPDEATSLGAA